MVLCSQGERSPNMRVTNDSLECASRHDPKIRKQRHSRLSFSRFSSRQVWSPAGGWWNSPPMWQRNTAVAGGVVALLFIGLCQVSSARERRPVPPLRHLPSQSWCQHAVEDDPSLAK
jgi:anti-sigma-K factor RskA